MIVDRRRKPFKDGYATTGEAAAVLGGIAPRTVNLLIGSGQLAAFRMFGEGHWRIPVDTLARFAATYKPNPNSARQRRSEGPCRLGRNMQDRRCRCRVCHDRIITAWTQLWDRAA